VSIISGDWLSNGSSFGDNYRVLHNDIQVCLHVALSLHPPTLTSGLSDTFAAVIQAVM
jgi:hypothetical protein